MERLLISACLLGVNCKYNGGNNALPEETLRALRVRYALVPVCPETAGGLPTPRPSCERRDGGVFSVRGADLTTEYARGAEIAVKLARRFDCRRALMKERSPSCGSGRIYDGSYSGTLIPGRGVAAEALEGAGVLVQSEDDIKQFT